MTIYHPDIELGKVYKYAGYHTYVVPTEILVNAGGYLFVRYINMQKPETVQELTTTRFKNEFVLWNR